VGEISGNTYDEVAYDCSYLPATHPERMAVLAWLHGLNAPRPERSRVLEVGCASGDNLMAIAETLHGATCVGIDNSPRQIDSGRALAQQLGLKNLDLRVMDPLEVDPSLGQYDYIVVRRTKFR
jgi:protein-L-isoaspartate O-methyltransferase